MKASAIVRLKYKPAMTDKLVDIAIQYHYKIDDLIGFKVRKNMTDYGLEERLKYYKKWGI